MKFTDIFIQRPVLSAVVSLLILVVGVRSLLVLSVREFPFTENGIITVETPYTGASPNLIESFITSTLESAIAQSNGIDYMTSVSSQGMSTISVFLQLNYDTDKAMTEITANISSVADQMPPESQAPEISIDVGQATDLMYIGFHSDVLNENEITDYIIRVAQPQIRAVNQILDAELLGQRQFALRAWLDPEKLAAYNLSADDVFTALDENDMLAAAGRSDGQMIAVNINIDTNLTSVQEFKDLVLKYENDAIVTLGDVASVNLGAESYDAAVRMNDRSAVYIGIQVVPDGNVLQVINRVKDAFNDIQEQLPEGLEADIVYDVTDFIDGSIHEVLLAITETIIIVTLVILAFLGTPRSALIPIVAIPLSLIGTFFIMYLFGYTINLLTLLSLVLAIGLVVDDAIIVVENVDRHIRDGLTPFMAAVKSARELANPIIAISIVVIAVYLPIGFMDGMTGALFTEFAFTLAGAVAVSAVIALTLSPMMCSKLMPSKNVEKNHFASMLDMRFEQLHGYYKKNLVESLNYLNVTKVFAGIIIVSLFFLYATSNKELAPDEDQGLILFDLTAAPNASVHQTTLYSRDMTKRVSTLPDVERIFQLDGITDANGSLGSLNTAQGGIVLKEWGDRDMSIKKTLRLAQDQADQVAGAKIALYQPSPLPGSVGLPIQFVIVTTKPFSELNAVATEFFQEANSTGLFSYIDNDLKLDMLQAVIEVDRYKAAMLGLTMADIGDAMTASLSQEYVNFFELDGRAYQVIPQMNRQDRVNYDQVLNYYIMTESGVPVQLSTFANIRTEVVPESLNHFHELHAATISAVLNNGVSTGTAMKALEKIAERVLPDGYDYDYAGALRQYEHESATLLITFVFSMIIIFLALSALFESFRDPIIILISVPMSIFGALIFINLGVGGASLNIYTQVGIVTLIGLISKHGILIVQFANTLQEEGKSKFDAIVMAAGIRLRPILMTTGAMVLGVIPLLLATGPGSESRFNIGLVIATGISIGTLFTLFVVPAMYMLLAKVHRPIEPIAE